MNPANYRKFYVISYAHSNKGELCFWRENNGGYTNDLQQAGKYTQKEIDEKHSYYNNGYYEKGKFIIENVAVPCEEVERVHNIRHIVLQDIDFKNKCRKQVSKFLKQLKQNQLQHE